MTIDELIKTVKVNPANLEYISKTGDINGSLYSEISRVINEYADQKVNDTVSKQISTKDREGVFIYNNGNIYTPEEYGEHPASGVILITKQTSIVIDVRDLAKEINWYDAMSKVKEIGKTLPDDHESIEILNHINEINRVLCNIGGEKIDGWYWTRKELYGIHSWNYTSYGSMNYYNKYNSFSVRAITHF